MHLRYPAFFSTVIAALLVSCTNVPSSIGKAASHGCIRMRNADVEELFELVDVGVTVELTAAHADWLTPAQSTLVAAVYSTR